MYPKLTGNGKFLSQIQYGSDYSKSTSSWINHEDMVNVCVIFGSTFYIKGPWRMTLKSCESIKHKLLHILYFVYLLQQNFINVLEMFYSIPKELQHIFNNYWRHGKSKSLWPVNKSVEIQKQKLFQHSKWNNCLVSWNISILFGKYSIIYTN